MFLISIGGGWLWLCQNLPPDIFLGYVYGSNVDDGVEGGLFCWELKCACFVCVCVRYIIMWRRVVVVVVVVVARWSLGNKQTNDE